MITGHWYVIVGLLLIVLIFFGPGKLPEIGGAVGKAIREFRNPSEPDRETDDKDKSQASAVVATSAPKAEAEAITKADS